MVDLIFVGGLFFVFFFVVMNGVFVVVEFVFVKFWLI